MDKVRVLLFAMTGFGNNVFKVLTKQSFVKIVGVFTSKREVKSFPYYECENLHGLITKSGITLYEGLKLKEEKVHQLIRTLSPDLILVSSFNQILPKAIITIPRIGIVNFHPSLLPKYRGATPTVWALMNGEKETGMTAHFIEDEKIDSGRIIAQEKIKIEPSDNDGILRCKLATLSEKVLIDALSLILKQQKETFPLQVESEATYYRKRTLEDSEINPDNSFMDNLNKINAMSPYPGAYLTYNGKRYIVSNATLLNSKSQVDTQVSDSSKLVVKTPEGIVLFSINGDENNGGKNSY